jgi:hypothetical protein
MALQSNQVVPSSDT